MKLFRRFFLTTLVFLGLGTSPAWAGHFAIGFNIGVPVFYRPFYPYPYYGYYYYRPYPVYPYPVYFAPPAVVVQPAPAVQAVPLAQPSCPASAPRPATVNAGQAEIERHLHALADANEQVRSESALQLGRLRAAEAIDSLVATLAGDSKAGVREAAARALGLIGSQKALPALQQAAQADSDPMVRHSAQFSIDVIHARG
jgi:hypothetical protein